MVSVFVSVKLILFFTCLVLKLGILYKLSSIKENCLNIYLASFGNQYQELGWHTNIGRIPSISRQEVPACIAHLWKKSHFAN